MTSRSSFFKLLKEDLRQRLWTIILAAIVFVLPVPIYIAMEISSSRGFGTGMLDHFAIRLAEPMSYNSAWMIMVTICGAFICAVSGFGYLFSKKKVDFFHSLPVKRETLFAVRYINGVLIYLVPYVVMALVSILIITVTGNMRAVVFFVVLKGLAVHLLGYLAIYTTFILCVTFVGNFVVFCAVSGWVFGITPIVLLIYNWFEEQFFNTYTYMGDALNERLHSLRFLCPEYFYIYSWNGREVGVAFVLLQELAFVAVLTVITLLVYKARPSDGAGKAIAFPILKPVIRISVELLAGALIGMLFHEAADRSYGVPGWMIFGAILGVVICHMLIQSIFYFDVRKCFADKTSLGVVAVVAVAFVLVMRYDTFGYDKYLPKEKKLESVAIDITGLDTYRNNYKYDGSYMNYTDEVYEMELTDIDAVYPYLESLVADNEYYWKLRERGAATTVTRVEVTYRLENGKTVYREYRVPEIRENLFAPVFESMEYKEVHYSDVYSVPENILESITAVHAMNTQLMNLSTGERTEFMAIVRRELAAQSLKEKLNTLPVAVLNLQFVSYRVQYDSDGMPYDNSRVYKVELPVYPSFTETLAFLAERGFYPDEEYEWTGKELMRIEFPEVVQKEDAGYMGDVWSTESVEVTEYVLTGDNNKLVEAQIEYPKDWDYGYNVIPVDEEDYKRLYELCTWEELYYYGGVSDYDRHENYRVSLDVPREGYNVYETYYFTIPEDADISFLLD
ncbi:MAG: hypothetical protein IKT67_03355 [Lachnospiraceae bacterium]|nr:hypothetical protein [Lachnospiraceae bacterium]